MNPSFLRLISVISIVPEIQFLSERNQHGDAAHGRPSLAAVAFAAPRLRLALTLTLTVGAQLTAAVVFDHFGVLGLERSPITLARMAGVVCILAGVLLVRR